MEIKLEHFLNLRFYHEYHHYHQEGTNCIYQDLIKNKKTIREILFAVSRNPEFLNIEKYNKNVLLKYDHMTHYIFCLLYGFRKNIISWRDKDNDSKYKLVDKNYYLSQEKMSDYEIKQYLSNINIDIRRNNIIDGYHRCFCMIGRILRGEKYIPFTCSYKAAPFILINNFFFKLCSFKISNVGYRPKHNKKRLKLIEKKIDTSNFSLVDIGSNFGYFSLNLAIKHPTSIVYSIEGSFGTGNDNVYNKNKIITTKGIKCHQRLKEKYFVFNNYIVCALMTQGVIKSLHKYNIVFDYQLSLSVFHWIVFEKLGNFGKPDNIYDLFFDHLTIAKTTFIELPDFTQETSLTPVYKKHKNLYHLFEYIENKYQLDMDVELLGQHNWYGKRSLYKITLQNYKGTKRLDVKKLTSIFNPEKVL